MEGRRDFEVGITLAAYAPGNVVALHLSSLLCQVVLHSLNE